MSKDTYRTLLIVVLGFTIVFLITGWYWSLLASIIIGGLSALSLKFARFFELLWMKLGYVLSLIIPKILLSLIFYLILTPIALISRIFTGDALSLRKSEASLWVQRTEEGIAKESFEKLW